MNSKITPELGRAAMRALFETRSPLGPLKVMAQHVGRFFQIPLPGFRPYVVFGPEAARKVLVTERDKLLWRNTDPVTDLLNHEWRKLLIRHHLSGDDIAWGVAMSTVGELVASVQPQPDVQSRKRLAARLPTLVRRICEGLDKLHVTDDRRLALTDQLFTLHAAVLRGAAPPAVRCARA